MREIKFRAWDKENSRWVTNYDNVYISDEGEVLTLEQSYGYEGGQHKKYRKYEICLFTGLKDKNGKEIYEGDIVKFGWLRKSTVTFAGGCFCIFQDMSFSDLWGEDGPDGQLECEVIGNIYENPEGDRG